MSKKFIVAITSCPVGIAHTYMAAENIQKAGEAKGVEIKVETHGSIGVENELTLEEIRRADGVIIAADTVVDKSRFDGKPLVHVGVQAGIKEPSILIDSIVDNAASIYMHSKNLSKTESEFIGEDGEVGEENLGKTIYKSLMNGVSYMVPFVVTGGLLIAIALSLGGDPTSGGLAVQEGTFWEKVLSIGVIAMGLMIPILSAYISVSIADRPGLVPGFIGGMIAANGSLYGSEANAGFLGGIIAGFLAGYIALAIKKIKVPKSLQSIMPIIIIPVISSLIVGFAFIYVIGLPVSSLFQALSAWLVSMQGGSQVVLAMILGAMIAVDMGGPFNKVAFLFGVGMIAEGNYAIMGSIAVAICIPPISVGVASLIGKNKFSKPEKEAGKASLAMGLFGITEGAIPFATSDPIRVIPSIVIGSMAGAVVAMLSNVGNKVAHGGPIVAILGAVDNTLMFFVSVTVGVIVSAGLLLFLKKSKDNPVNNSSRAEIVNASNKTKTDLHSFNKLTNIMNENMIVNELKASNKDEAIDILISTLFENKMISSKEKFKEVVLTREGQSSTGIGMEIAIPHGKSDVVTKPAVVFGRNLNGLDWDSLDGEPTKLVFMIAVPTSHSADTHLKILQMLSRKLMNDDFRKELLEAKSSKDIFRVLDKVVDE